MTEHRGKDWLLGYCGALLSASLLWVFAEAIAGYLLRGAYSPPTSFQFVGSGLILSLVVAIFAFPIAIVPSLAMYWLARRFFIANVWYYLFSGALIGLAYTPIAVVLAPRLYFLGDPPDSPLLDQIAGVVVSATACAAIGGLVFWWIAGRFIRSRASSAAAA